jgi:hypothetical protein
VTLEIIRQLAKSGGSTSANYHACCRARSRAEFIAKLGVAVEEADESEHWLRVLSDKVVSDRFVGRPFQGRPLGAELDVLYDESRQLRAILKASHSTARPNAARSQPVESARTNKSANPNPNPNPKILKS